MYCTQLALYRNLITITLLHFLGDLPQQTIPFLFLGPAADEAPHPATLVLQEGPGEGVAEQLVSAGLITDCCSQKCRPG